MFNLNPGKQLKILSQNNWEITIWHAWKTNLKFARKLPKEIDCWISLKTHFSAQNLGSISDKDGEKFNQHILTVQRHNGPWDPEIMGNIAGSW